MIRRVVRVLVFLADSPFARLRASEATPSLVASLVADASASMCGALDAMRARAPSYTARASRAGANPRARNSERGAARRAFPQWNPFVSAPDDPGRLSSADKTRADDSDGVLGRDDSWRSMRDAETLRIGISRPDAYFADMGVRFDFDERVESSSRDFEALNQLFVSVGFSARAREKLEKAVDNSHVALWATTTRDSRFARKGQVVGFARATSDGTFNATIWDVAVSPAWQRHGIGQGLVERIVDRILDEDICNVGLYSEGKVVKLYESLGFRERCPRRAVAMQFRHDTAPYT